MRQVLSISLPKGEVAKVKQTAKKRGFKNLSAYIYSLLEADEELITEDQILKAWKEGIKEYRAGKTVQAKSLRDLV